MVVSAMPSPAVLPDAVPSSLNRSTTTLLKLGLAGFVSSRPLIIQSWASTSLPSGTRTARDGIVLAEVPEFVEEQPLREARPQHLVRVGSDIDERGGKEVGLIDRTITGGGRCQHRDRGPG